MAIVEMRKLRLLALRRDKGKILRGLQGLCCVQVVGDEEFAGDAPVDTAVQLGQLEQEIARLDWAIGKTAPFDPMKAGFLAGKPEKDQDDWLQALASREEILGVVSRLEAIEREMGELKTRQVRDEAQIQAMTPWQNLDTPLEEIRPGREFAAHLYSIPSRDYTAFTAALSEFSVEPSVEELSRTGNAVNVFLVVHADDSEALDQLVKTHGAVSPQMEGLTGTPALVIDRAQGALERIQKGREDLEAEIRSLGGRCQELKVLRDTLHLDAARLGAEDRFAETGTAFLLTAWVPEEKTDEVRRVVHAAATAYDIEFLAPADGENPPILLRNSKTVRPFESIVRMYSLPDYRGLDPTAVMMPFFICYFGLMVSDAAYGILLALGAFFLARKLKGRGTVGQIASIAVLGGIGTVIWGALLGGWFGIEDAPALLGFTPMSEPLMMMVLCLGLGAVQIITGMLVSVYMSVKRGKIWDAVFDQGFWFVIFAGIGVILVNSTVGLCLIGAGVLGIILTGGRKKKGAMRLLSGLGKLYDITGYMSDILSYARLFGMGLATGVVAMVMNKVAMMLWGGFGTVFAILILIGGHAFNIAINALGAYVHSCRLQYIEFFGKFYEDGGTAFQPLDTAGRYVDFKGEDA